MNRQRCEELIGAHLDERLTDAERDELHRLLESDAEARRLYWQSVEQHALIGDVLGAARGRDFATLSEGSFQAQAVTPNLRVALPGGSRIQRVVGWIGGIALIAALAMGLLFWGIVPEDEAPIAAWMTRSIDCDWSDSTRFAQGQGVARGQVLDLRSGVVELTTPKGVRLSLQGPACLEFTTEEPALLHHGRATAYVPEAALGFVLLTPDLRVLDLGTEFGVAVKDGENTEVHVFEGKVELSSRNPGRQLPLKILEEDQAVRVAGQGAEVEQLTAQLQNFPSASNAANSPTQVVFRDDFSAPLLDSAKWRTIPTGKKGSEVQVVDGTLELANRTYLVTSSEFDPVERGGLRIVGTWKFTRFLNDRAGNFELMNIFTRCTGQAMPAFPFQPTGGLRFRMDTRGKRPHIHACGSDLQITSHVQVGGITIEEGDVCRFEVIDDGRNLSFTLTKVNDPTQTASVTATVVQDVSTTNFVVFLNREGRHVAHLDDIKISVAANAAESAENRP